MNSEAVSVTSILNTPFLQSIYIIHSKPATHDDVTFENSALLSKTIKVRNLMEEMELTLCLSLKVTMMEAVISRRLSDFVEIEF